MKTMTREQMIETLKANGNSSNVSTWSTEQIKGLLENWMGEAFGKEYASNMGHKKNS